MLIRLKPEEILLIQKVVRKNFPEAKLAIFGSRTIGKNQQFSDIDLLIDIGRVLDFSELCQLKFEFSETELDYFVDVVDANAVSQQFKASISKNCVFI